MGRRGTARRPSAAAFSFGVQVEILVDALHDGGLEACDLANFVQKIVQLAVDAAEED